MKIIVRAIWMNNDYTWGRMEKSAKTKEQAEEISSKISNRLNKLLNAHIIKDYRVEY